MYYSTMGDAETVVSTGEVAVTFAQPKQAVQSSLLRKEPVWFSIMDDPLYTTVMAVGLLWTYARIPFVYGTIWLLMLAYITRYLPFGLRTTSATIVQIHRDLEDASRASGAGWARTLQSVILPLIKPGFLAGWIFLSVLFLRELSTSILLYSTGSEVLAVMVYSLNEDGEHVLVAALGVMMVALTLFMSGVAMKIARVKLI